MALQDTNFYNGNIPDYLEKSFALEMVRYAPNGQAPLFAYASLLGETQALATEHGYFAKTMVFPGTTLGAAVADGAATTFNVADSSTLLEGDLLRNQATGEVVRVQTIASATSITVKRGMGQIAPAAMGNGSALYGIGNAFEQASKRPASRLMNPVRVLNYTHIFRNAWALPNTVAAIKAIVGDGNISESRTDAGMFHSSDIERATIFSQKSSGFVNQQYITTMDGIVETVRRLAPAANTNTAGATTNYTQLETMLNTVFDTINNGRDGNVRTLYVGGQARSVINKIGRLSGSYQIMDGQNQFGLRFQSFRTSRGDFNMVEHPQFNSNPDWRKMALAVDLGAIRYAYLRKTTNEEYGPNGQMPQDGQDATGGVLTTEVTLEIKNPSAHAVVYGLTDGAAG